VRESPNPLSTKEAYLMPGFNHPTVLNNRILQIFPRNFSRKLDWADAEVSLSFEVEGVFYPR
jgi:hypothetical protein